MISEQLQNRIAGLTGNSMTGMSQMGKGAISNKDIDMAMRALGLPDDASISTQKKLQQLATANAMAIAQTGKGAISNKDLEKYIQTMPNLFPQAQVDPRDLIKNLPAPAVPLVEDPRDLIKTLPFMPGAMSDLEMQLLPERMQPTTPGTFQDDNQVIDVLQEAIQKETDPETKEELQRRLNQYLQSMTAPASPMAQEVKALGMGDDTELAHVRPGEVILPPEFFSDTKFESMVENKFKQAGIDPEQAVVGSGIASLNEITGLPQYGFFKKIGKKLKKVVKKVAPVALLATGVAGFAGAGPLGGFLGKGAAKATTGKIFGAGGKFRTGLGAFFNPAKGTPGIFGGKIGPGIRRGIGGLFGGRQEAPNIDALASDPQYKTRIARLRSEGLSDQQILQELGMAQDPTGIFGGTLGPRLRERFLGTGDQPGVIGNILGGGQQEGGGGLFGGGFGDALKMGGIGALAAGLGKLAYEDAQKQKGVPLTPLTTMSPTGRYNIEAEIARRMGQPAPNPVEFGLLPAGTIPELSGGKPRGMMYGGGVEDLTGGMVRGLANGGGVMAFAQGGAVQMQEGGEMDPSQFPRMDGDINGPGTETSDDIPAMLSDGEFVMTGRAVRGAGSYEMQADPNGIISLMPTLQEDRERGMDLMYKMMDTFANKAKAP
jgi:hypothetical protein